MNKKFFFIFFVLFSLFIILNFTKADTCTSDSSAKIDVWSQGQITLDNLAYAAKNPNNDFVALFKNSGDLYLKGVCVSNPNCNPPSSSFIIKNSLGEVVSYLDPSGNLCVETGDCSDLSSSCNPINKAFLVKNPSGKNIIYIDNTGDLCLMGALYKGSDIAKEYLLNLLQQTSHNSKVVKFESINNDNSIVVSVGGVSSSSMAVGTFQLINGLNVKNVEANCATVTTTTTSTTTSSTSLGIGETTTSSTTSTTVVGGGGGGDTGGGQSNTRTYSRVKADELKEYYPTTNVKVTRIAFKLKEETRDVRLKVKKLSSPGSITKPDGEVYQYFEIDFNVERSKFSLSRIEFEVENEWINRKGLTKNDIKLMKYSGGSWIELATNKFSETNTRTNYEVPDAKGFSTFAIVGKQTIGVTPPPVNQCGNGVINSNEDCNNCPSDVRCGNDEYCNYGVCAKRQVQPPENTCGNGIRNLGEDCRSCPGDVRCGVDEYCRAGVCVEVQKKPEFNIMDYIWTLIIGILILVVLIVAIIIYLGANKGKKARSISSNSGNKKIGELRTLVEEQLAQGYSKEQIRVSAMRAGWPKDMVDEILKSK